MKNSLLTTPSAIYLGVIVGFVIAVLHFLP